MKNWKTTLFGFLAGLAQLAPVLHSMGVGVGHLGATDFLQLAGGIATMVVGAVAKDANVTGGTVQQ